MTTNTGANPNDRYNMVFETRFKALRVLYDTVIEIEKNHDIPHALSTNLIKLTQTQYCGFLKYDREKSEFRFVCQYNQNGILINEHECPFEINTDIEVLLKNNKIIKISEYPELEKIFFEFIKLSGLPADNEWYSISISYENDLFALLILRTKTRLKCKDIIEHLSNFSAMVMHRIKMEGELRLSKEMLAKSEGESRQILENCGVAMCLIDKDFNISKFNKYFKDLFTIPDGQHLKCHDIFKINLCHTNQCLIKQVMETKERVETDICLPEYTNEKNIYVNMIGSPIIENGEISGIILAINDIADLKKAHQEVSQSYEALQLKSDELKMTQASLIETSKMSAIGTLAAGVAHEFNNILTIISGYVELSNSLITDSYIKKTFVIIKDAVKRGQKITSDLMEFYYQNGVGGKSYVNLEEMIKSTLLFSEKTLNNNRINVELNLDKVPLFKAASNQLSHVLINLISNACDAMENSPEKKLAISLFWCKNNKKGELCKLKNDCVHEEGCIWLSISDTGCGMDETTKNKIFEPFFTTKGVIADGAEAKPGTGLGLFVSYEIVKKHNGKFFVNSQPGKGTAMKIQFLLDQSQEPDELINEPFPKKDK